MPQRNAVRLRAVLPGRLRREPISRDGDAGISQPVNPLEHLSEIEQDCVRRYVVLLAERLGDNLVEVLLFGSAARGDMWSDRFPIRSDIDLLVLTREQLSKSLEEELINETYPLFLECGRQVGPQWRTVERWESPQDERAEKFKETVEAEGRQIWRR